jgi:hypothetical protein
VGWKEELEERGLPWKRFALEPDGPVAFSWDSSI